MTVYSYVGKTFEQGGYSGVCRFDFLLRQVFPFELQSATVLPELKPDDVVITDNHLSLDVPAEIKAIVVHHGCAATHYERDPQWRNESTKALVEGQQRMFDLPNRTFVAPGEWVADQFGDRPFTTVTPHWVDSIPPLPKGRKPVIIGDWRDSNKGAYAERALRASCPQWEFRGLSFRGDQGRREQYGSASLYLCLSLSEGGPYSVCDAEAAELPIVTTDVGNYREFEDCEVIRWQDRDNVGIVADAIERKLRVGRELPGFYREYTFEKWAGLWRNLVSQ